MKTIRRLAAELRRDSPRLSCAEVEGADLHPLAKAGIIKPVEILKRWRCYACDERCFEEVDEPSAYTDDSGKERWRVYCAGGGTFDVPSPYVAAIWDYNSRRMAETLRDLLRCSEARCEIGSGAWRLGQSGHTHIKPFNVVYITRIRTSAEQATAKAIASDLRSIVIAGYVDPDSDLGGFRYRVATITEVLAIDEKHRLTVNAGTLLSLKQVLSTSVVATRQSQIADDVVERIGEKIEKSQDAILDAIGSSTSSLPSQRDAVVAFVRELYSQAKAKGRASIPKIVRYIRFEITESDVRYYNRAMAVRAYVTAFVNHKNPKNNAERDRITESCWNSIATESKPSYDKAAAKRRNRLNADPSAPPGVVPILDFGI